MGAGMVTLTALKNHPFYGRSKKAGEQYEATPFDANLMVKLGFAKVAEPVISQPAPVVEEQKVLRAFPVPVVYQAGSKSEPVKRKRGRPVGSYKTRQLVAEE
jgi:hypothetical protein